ncbi:MarR family transcriptional regulator [Kribbella sp. NPDC000426]|uniref:MarR family transcriptional regulator n=1 Tax=Kribbella sp. NPDC000426 TaxID=3154255 RepID=UPI003323F6D7
MLARLESDGPASPSALAEQEGVRPQAMAVTLAALEERGLVSREPRAAARSRRTAAPSRPKGLAEAIEDEFSQAERRELQQLPALLDRLSERL